MKYIGIIDYHMGNLHSVFKAIEKVGGSPKVITHPKDLNNVSAIILPGVGSFDLAMSKLQELNFVQPIKFWVTQGLPFLGICLGLQLLFSRSEEGRQEGLNIFEGKVIKINPNFVSNTPHMGWSKLIANSINFNNRWVYFVHSYHVIPKVNSIETSFIQYGKLKILSSIKNSNVIGMQFHPEKSGEAGLLILKQFLLEHHCL